jgi:hypothetical protein
MKKSELIALLGTTYNLVVWELLYTMDQEHLVVLYALDDDNISVMIYNQKGFLSGRLVFYQGQKIYC